MSNIYAVVPARSGSKGVPHKNIKPLGNKPLFMWTIDAAVQSDVDNIILSSDSQEYLDLCEYNDVMKVERPSQLAQDDVLTSAVIIHALDAACANDDDIILLLQPTCPFRTVSDINQAIALMKMDLNCAVISVVDVGGDHPLRMKRIVNGCLVNYVDTGFEDMRPRQELPSVYIRSGSIYACSVKNYRKHKNFYGDRVLPIVEPADYAVNIDTPRDFLIAEKTVANITFET